MHGFAGIVPMQCRVKKGSFVVHFYNLYSLMMIQSNSENNGLIILFSQIYDRYYNRKSWDKVSLQKDSGRM